MTFTKTIGVTDTKAQHACVAAVHLQNRRTRKMENEFMDGADVSAVLEGLCLSLGLDPEEVTDITIIYDRIEVGYKDGQERPDTTIDLTVLGEVLRMTLMLLGINPADLVALYFSSTQVKVRYLDKEVTLRP